MVNRLSVYLSLLSLIKLSPITLYTPEIVAPNILLKLVLSFYQAYCVCDAEDVSTTKKDKLSSSIISISLTTENCQFLKEGDDIPVS